MNLGLGTVFEHPSSVVWWCCIVDDIAGRCTMKDTSRVRAVPRRNLVWRNGPVEIMTRYTHTNPNGKTTCSKTLS